MAGESCLFAPYPCSFGKVKALCKTQCSSPLSHLWPSFSQFSFLKNFYVKLKGFLVAASIFKKCLTNVSISKSSDELAL